MLILQPLRAARFLLIPFLALAVSGAPAQDAPERSIEHIAEDVYFFHNNIHNSIFMVTEEGILLVDPLNREAAEWLKDELASRFGQEVKYIIYSHFHGDHASGAEAFGDSVIDIFAHENTPGNILQDRSPDRVRVLPTRTYREYETISLGGKTVELIHLDSDAHASDMTVVRFPEERIIFVVDVVSPGRVMFRYLGGPTLEKVNDVNKMLEQLDLVAALDFDILANGHFGLGTVDDIRANQQYLVDLRDRVAAEMAAGKELPEILETVTMEDYSHLGFYNEFLAMNVEAMHYWLSRRGDN